MVYLRTFTIKINKKSTQFMSFSDPTPQKTGSNLITSTKIIKNQPRWMQQTLIIYLRSLATVWIPSKTLRSSKVTNLAKPSQPWDDTSSSLNDGNSSFSLRRWIRRVPEVIWFWLSRSSVWTSAQTQLGYIFLETSGILLGNFGILLGNFGKAHDSGLTNGLADLLIF